VDSAACSRRGRSTSNEAGSRSPAGRWATVRSIYSTRPAGGVHTLVELVDAPDGLNDSIDEEYRRKYARYSESTLNRITSQKARSTTLWPVPR